MCSLPFWCLNSASGHAEPKSGEPMLLTSCLNSDRIHKMCKSPSLSAKGPDPICMFKAQLSFTKMQLPEKAAVVFTSCPVQTPATSLMIQ